MNCYENDEIQNKTMDFISRSFRVSLLWWRRLANVKLCAFTSSEMEKAKKEFDAQMSDI